MKFDTDYAHYGMSRKIIGNGYCLFRSTSHKRAVEIGTGSLINTAGFSFVHENTNQEVSKLKAHVIIDDYDLGVSFGIIAKLKAHRMKFLNPNSKVQIAYPNYITQVLFPTDEEYIDRFVLGKDNVTTLSQREYSMPLSILLLQGKIT